MDIFVLDYLQSLEELGFETSFRIYMPFEVWITRVEIKEKTKMKGGGFEINTFSIETPYPLRKDSSFGKIVKAEFTKWKKAKIVDPPSTPSHVCDNPDCVGYDPRK